MNETDFAPFGTTSILSNGTSISRRATRSDNFQPERQKDVDVIKNKSAELIDLCEKLKAKAPRLASLAQTAYEEAAMWAVKAATT